MRDIKLYIATSIDSYITDTNSNNPLDWLTNYPNPQNLDYGYAEFYDSVDTLIMGAETYRSILAMDIDWPYPNKKTYVITRGENNINTSGDNIHFLNENILKTIDELKYHKGKDIWLVGGGQIISMLLNANLLNSMIITYFPVILGDGAKLFPQNTKQSKWEIIEFNNYTNSVTQITYRIK